MNAWDCLRFLVGDAGAIRRIAACRASVWVGLVFVLMASLAREYDQEDLVHEPWRLLASPGASLLVASVLYAFVRGVGKGERTKEPFAVGWRRFVALFWMTGPLAWIYAVPYEQFLETQQAVAANLWSLGLVATWRVLLIIRVVSVVHEVPFRRAAGVVLLVADVVALALIQLLPFPIIVVMGGAQDPATETIRGTACAVLGWGVVTLPVWFGMTMFARIDARKQGGWRDGSALEPTRAAHVSIWLFAALLLAASGPAVGAAQHRQVERAEQRRARVAAVMAAVEALPPPKPAEQLSARERQLRQRLLAALGDLDRDTIERMSTADATRIAIAVLMRPGLGDSVKPVLRQLLDGHRRRFRMPEAAVDEWLRLFG